MGGLSSEPKGWGIRAAQKRKSIYERFFEEGDDVPNIHRFYSHLCYRASFLLDQRFQSHPRSPERSRIFDRSRNLDAGLDNNLLVS